MVAIARQKLRTEIKANTKVLVETYYIYDNPVLHEMTKWANNCYNECLYLLRHQYFKNVKTFKHEMREYKHGRIKVQPKWNKLYTKQDLIHIIKRQGKYHQNTLVDTVVGIKMLSNVIDNVLDTWSNYFKALSDFKKHPYKYLGKPRMPHYLVKGSRHAFKIDNQMCYPDKHGNLHSNAYQMDIKMSDNLKYYLTNPTNDKTIAKVPYKNRVRTTWVKPINKGVKVCVSYLVSKTPRKTYKGKTFKLNNNYVVGADPGVNNLFTLASNNFNINPLIINGKGIKSVNQFYNKRKAELQDLAAKYKQKGITIHKKDGTTQIIYHTGKKFTDLVSWRNNKILTAIHKATDRIIAYTINCEASKIVIGRNKYWKQGSNMGKKTNQNFTSIPHYQVIQILKYKAALYGIEVITQPEAYTSQTSFLDNEKPVWINGDKARKKHSLSPAKRRLKRGLYKSNEGYKINADVNGALQILRKYNSQAFCNTRSSRKQIVGVVLHPLKWSPLF